MSKSLTAALAVIKVTGVDNVQHTIGKMRNLRVTENIRRGRVVGLGNLNPSEIPALEWSGTVNAGQYAIKLDTGILYSLARNFSTTAEFVQNLLFNEGVDISILMKAKTPDGQFTEETFCTIQKCHITSEGLDVTEGQIGGRDATFEYLEPIIYG